jgi:hypothetical protein
VVARLSLGLLALGCAYDAEQRCGKNQVLDGRGRCGCTPDTVLVGQECLPCPAGEEVSAGKCSCVAGTQRNPEGLCVPSQAGESCNPQASTCSESFPYCHAKSAEAGYCTSTGCTSPAQCPEGYACRLEASPAYCERPPVGLGRSCQGTEDCAGTEATFCDTYLSFQCIVQGCSISDDDCFSGWDCCDFTTLGLNDTLCVPEGQCPTR